MGLTAGFGIVINCATYMDGAAVRIQVIMSLLQKAHCEDLIQPAERQRLNVDGVLLQISAYVIKSCKCKIDIVFRAKWWATELIRDL